MRPAAVELLRLLADMPFLDRLEMTAVSGRSRGAVYRSVRKLEDAGLVASVPHGTELTAPTRRFHLTASGLRRLARAGDATLEELLADRPVSARWRRILLERLDAAAVVYRLVSAMSAIARPVRLRWYRAMALDAGTAVPGGGTVGIVRQGVTADRTGFGKRWWRLSQGPQPGCVLLLFPDEVRLRHARRRLAPTPAAALFALERDAAEAGPDDPVWRPRSVSGAVSLRTALKRLDRRGALAVETPLVRGASLPPDIDAFLPEAEVPGHLLPTVLRPAEKRALDMLGDWPWISLGDLAGLLGVSRPRASQVTALLTKLGLIVRAPVSDRGLTVTDPGLAALARRDRVAVGTARRRWSVLPEDAADWSGVSGRRTRQLLRDIDHTQAVHGFVSALARQARGLGWEIDQLDPPHRASRYFPHLGARRSIHPDAFGVLRRGDAIWPFFLEWERRAVRPAAMTERLAPYLRYYASHRPLDDHGARPVLLVVFEDDLAAVRFVRVAVDALPGTARNLPLLVSHRGLVEREGPLGRVWLAPGGGWDPDFPVPQEFIRR